MTSAADDRQDHAPTGAPVSDGAGRRLLFVITSLDYGGAEAQVVELTARFRERGWHVATVSLIEPRAYESELTAVGAELHSLGMPRGVPDPRGVARLAAIYARFRPDVVHAHMVHANVVARLARLLTPVPCLVSTVHNVVEGGRWMTHAYRLTDGLSEFTSNVSREGVDRYVRLGAVPAAKCAYVPNGINLRRFRRDPAARAAVRASLGVDKGFVWLAVGRFTEQKDFPNLFSAIASRGVRSRLWMVGDGELRAELEALAVRLGIADDVTFLGRRSDVADLMSAADGYVLSSAWEGLPMVLLEAAATGLPAVATAVGGVPQIVRPDTGRLVPAGDPAALAAAMSEVEELSPERLREMGELGRAAVMTTFDVDAVVTRWEDIYRVVGCCRDGGARRRARAFDGAALGALVDGLG